jgi:hypothetical protein
LKKRGQSLRHIFDVYDCTVAMPFTCSFAEQQHFYAAKKSFDAAPAPAPTRSYSKATFLKNSDRKGPM